MVIDLYQQYIGYPSYKTTSKAYSMHFKDVKSPRYDTTIKAQEATALLLL